MQTNFGNSTHTQFGGHMFTPIERDALIVNSNQINSAALQDAFGGYDVPDVINTGYAMLWSNSTRFKRKPLLDMTEGKGEITVIRSGSFRYMLSGNISIKARVTAKVCPDVTPGKFMTSFFVVIDRPLWSASEVVHPRQNQEGRCRVMQYEGANTAGFIEIGVNQYQYQLKLMNPMQEAFLRPEFLEVGTEWVAVSSAVTDESNYEGVGFTFFNTFSMQGQIGQFAAQMAYTDKAMRKCKEYMERKATMQDCEMNGVGDMVKTLGWNMKTGDSEVYTYYNIALAEGKLRERLYCDVENALEYGRRTNHLVGSDGYTVRTGDGLRYQAEAGGTLIEYAGNLPLDQIEAGLENLVFNRLGEDVKILMHAGNEFRKLFSAAIASKANSMGLTLLDTHFIQKRTDMPKHLSFGAFYTAYHTFNYELHVTSYPHYDNPEWSTETHPLIPNKPIDSWRACIFDISNPSNMVADNGMGSAVQSYGSGNIKMIKEDYLDYAIRGKGKWDGGQVVNGNPITDGSFGILGGISGYSYHIEKSAGILLVDPTRAVTFKLAVN